MKKIGLVIFVVLISLGFYVNVQSNELRVTRSLAITAPAEKIFEQVNNFHHWQKWSPWVKLDPNAQYEYAGSPKGVGSIFSWNGNKDIGQGSNSIVVSRPAELIQIKSDWIKPFKSTSTYEFMFQPQGNQAVVTWAMFGLKNFMMKAMSLVMDCDKMVGAQFEEGLGDLKRVVE